MSDPSHFDAEIRALFSKEIPEVAAGTAEIVSMARRRGRRLMVAVRVHDAAVDAVSVFTGSRGVHAKNIVRALNGEHLTIVRWSDFPADFILAALGPLNAPGDVVQLTGLPTPKVTLDSTARRARVEVDQKALAYAMADEDLYVRLPAELVGWDIQLVLREGDSTR